MVVASILDGAVLGQSSGDDPFLWLEDVHGEASLAWVAEQNAVALDRLKTDPAYQQNYDTVLALLNAEDRIPMGSLRGDYVFNFWQDAVNERGLWRRTTRESYETVEP